MRIEVNGRWNMPQKMYLAVRSLEEEKKHSTLKQTSGGQSAEWQLSEIIGVALPYAKKKCLRIYFFYLTRFIHEGLMTTSANNVLSKNL